MKHIKEEFKLLLLKDLYARLPYGTIIQVKEWATVDTELKFGHIERLQYDEIELKPYLRPMSSMTEEECLELSRIKPIYDEVEAWKYIKTPIPLHIANVEQFDFFNSHHLDWRNLITKGLALEAPEGMYQIK